MCLTFQMMTLEKDLTKNFDFFLGGTPILAPRSAASQKMTIPALSMTHLFLLQNPFFLEKCGCLQKLEIIFRVIFRKWREGSPSPFRENNQFYPIKNN